MGGDGLAEKVLRSRDAAGLTQVEINSAALLIHCPIQVLPIAFDVDVGFIDPP